MKALLAVLVGVSLSGCAKPGGECVPVASLQDTLKQPNTAAGWRSKLDSCLGRWGYSLAKADGSVDDLARATLGGCQDALTSMVSQQAGEDMRDHLVSPAYDDALRDARRDALEKAAFYVAVGRAGSCERPL